MKIKTVLKYLLTVIASSLAAYAGMIVLDMICNNPLIFDNYGMILYLLPCFIAFLLAVLFGRFVFREKNGKKTIQSSCLFLPPFSA